MAKLKNIDVTQKNQLFENCKNMFPLINYNPYICASKFITKTIL